MKTTYLFIVAVSVVFVGTHAMAEQVPVVLGSTKIASFDKKDLIKKIIEKQRTHIPWRGASSNQLMNGYINTMKRDWYKNATPEMRATVRSQLKNNLAKGGHLAEVAAYDLADVNKIDALEKKAALKLARDRAVTAAAKNIKLSPAAVSTLAKVSNITSIAMLLTAGFVKLDDYSQRHTYRRMYGEEMPGREGAQTDRHARDIAGFAVNHGRTTSLDATGSAK